jgi:hypothetical protein
VAGELHAAAQAVLTAGAALLAEAAPARQYVANGQPAVDCPQLTVHVELVEVVNAGGGSIGAMPHPAAPRVFVATLALERWDYACVGTGDTPPTEVQLTDEAKLLGEEGWMVFCRLPGVLAEAEGCEYRGMLGLGPGMSSGDGGDMTGWRVRLQAEVGGWR